MAVKEVKEEIFSSFLSTPIGELIIQATTHSICRIGCRANSPIDFHPSGLTERACEQLSEYFEGKRTDFDLPMAQTGTDFQQKVWRELLTIPPGYPISYAALSRRMGNPLAIRAVAAANGRNKIMIVIPCHRVIGSSGELVGYAGGLWRKKWLLQHESQLTKTGQMSLL